MKKRKKGVKKKGRVKKTKRNKLLMTGLVILCFLVLIGIFIKISEVEEEKIRFEGELATLKWDLEKKESVLDVLNYSVFNNNQTINVTINWSSGEFADLRTILIEFNKIEGDCNYTNNGELLNYGENKTYEIDISNTNCNDFSNITGVGAFAQVDIPLRQINLIENITIYTDDNLIDVVDLDVYFSCLGNISFSVGGDSDRTGIRINRTTNKISFEPRINWYGVYDFNLTADCDGEILNVSSNGENMTFYVIALNETKILESQNHAPDFLNWCENLTWRKNTNYVLDMENCFNDSDGDNLTFRYVRVSNKLIVNITGDRLILTPESNWTGRGYFYIYGEDSIDETWGKVNFEVIVGGTPVVNITPPAVNISNVTKPKIISTFPSPSRVVISLDSSLNFSITAENYDSIKWYLDGVLMKQNINFYRVSELDEGNYTVKAEIERRGMVDIKTWDLVVSGKELPKRGSGGYFIIIYIVLGVFILFIILFIIKSILEKKEEAGKFNPIIKSGIIPGIKRNSSFQDNIPGR